MNDPSDVERSVIQRYGYWGCQQACRLAGTLAYRIRCFGQANFPTQGGGLVLANHQSHLDPVLIGMCCPRRMNYLAKKSLFKFKPFGWLIDFLDAIPLEREGIGIAGIKETIRRTRRGELLLLFPEGARTYDGEMRPLLPGAASIAKRSRVPLVPVGLDGAFRAWPRTKRFPKLGHVVIAVDRPIPFSEYESLSEDQITALLTDRIQACHQLARKRRIAMLQ
jgi:1-acyl-sn-glycerol-3-phosphate acyltransferase